LNGRIVIQAGAVPVSAQLRYGESTVELRRSPFLGTIPIRVPANGLLRGPKTGFRYALVSFAGPHDGVRVEAEGVVYPVRQVGNFSSNDPLLNRIWESSVYTAHLCMQDSILDGIKRDRGLWIGDSEVIHRTVADVYGDSRLVKAGLEDSLGPAPVKDHINGLPGYSAWWVVAESEYVQRWGDLAQLKSVQSRLVELLSVMERELDANKLYAAAAGGKPFVDWAPGLSHDSPEARRATHFEYLLAFRRAAWLLRLAGDTNTADRYTALADAMTQAAQQHLLADQHPCRALRRGHGRRAARRRLARAGPHQQPLSQRPHHALLRQLSALRHGLSRPPRRSACLDQKLLGRNASQRRNQLLGSLGPRLGWRRSAHTPRSRR
jgi:hypothetical protein